jgi:hypothetical protein
LYSETKVALNDSNIRLSMPLTKVDTEKRLVHGFATLDSLDKQADIVTKEASVAAFREFKGNIREQHDPHKAVGKMISFQEDSVYDKETNKVYSGVFVSVYVSKGAEDTWQKVLDGTLSGFSIGGAIKKTDVAYDEDLDKSVRIIQEYSLNELSLVDNPANNLASVVSVEKLEDGRVDVQTPLLKGDLENIFWCKRDSLIVLKQADDATCSICDNSMSNVGFVESNDPEKNDMIKATLNSFKKTLEQNLEKEANNMAEDAIVEDSAEIAKSEDAVDVAPAVEESEPEAVEPEVAEAEAVEEDVEKANEAEVAPQPVEDAVAAQVSELSGNLLESLSKFADVVEALNARFDEMSKSMGLVADQVETVKSEVADVKGNVNEFGKRVDAVEDTTAFRKSGDLGEVVQETEIRKSSGSFWGSRFLNVDAL